MLPKSRHVTLPPLAYIFRCAVFLVYWLPGAEAAVAVPALRQGWFWECDLVGDGGDIGHDLSK